MLSLHPRTPIEKRETWKYADQVHVCIVAFAQDWVGFQILIKTHNLSWIRLLFFFLQIFQYKKFKVVTLLSTRVPGLACYNTPMMETRVFATKHGPINSSTSSRRITTAPSSTILGQAPTTHAHTKGTLVGNWGEHILKSHFSGGPSV
jgi:hypothetical protein